MKWCQRISVDKKFLLSKKINPLMSAAGLFKYVWPFCYHQALKG